MRKFLLASCLAFVSGYAALAQCPAAVSQPGNQTVCAGGITAPVTFNGSPSRVSFNWTNSNPAVGLAASGSGNLPSFTAVNNTNAPATATITVTPALTARAYVPNNTGAGTVSVIDLATGTAIGSPISVGAFPFGVAVLPDQSKVYVSNSGSDNVSVISTATNTVVGSSPYTNPHGLVAAPDGSRVYVGGFSSNSISRIDPVTNISVFMANVAGPEGMAISPDGSRLYVASTTSGNLAVLNTATNAVTYIGVGAFPHGVALSPGGQFVYVANNGTDNVSVINTATNTVVATIVVGDAPLGVAVSPNGSFVYVSNSGTDNVSVISTATNTVVSTIAAGDYPYGISVHPDGSQVYVANKNSGTVTVLSTATNTVTGTYSAGTAPIALGNFVSACSGAGTAKTFTITVNPLAQVDQPGNQTVCAGLGTAAVAFVGTAGYNNYNWTNDNPSIGLAASGSGDVPSFTAVNNGSTAQTATITVTPQGNNPGRYAYFSNRNANTVSVLDSVTNTVTATIPVDNLLDWIAVSRNGTRVYAASSTGMAVINATTGTVVATIPVSPGPAIVSPDGTRVYAASSSGMSVINAVTNTVIANIPLGTSPFGIAVSPDGSRVYVTGTDFFNTNNYTVSVINTAANTVVASIPVGEYPNGIAVSPDGSNVYVANRGLALAGNTVSVISTATNTVTANIPVGDAPVGVAVSPDGSRVYVTNQISGNVSVINTATNAVLTTIPVSTDPIGISVSPDGGRLYVTNPYSNNVSVINTSTNTVTANIAVPSGVNNVGNFVASGMPQCAGTPKTFTITVNPSPTATISYPGSPFCNTGAAMPTLTGTSGGTYSSAAGLSLNATSGVINLGASTPGTYTVTYTIPAAAFGSGCTQVPAVTSVTISPNPVVGQPGSQTLCAAGTTAAIAFSGTGASYTWTNDNPSINLAASGSGNIPSFTAANSGTTVQTATITVTPQGGAPVGYAYVPNEQSDNVSVINTATNTVTATIPVGNHPFGVTVSPDGSRLYVANNNSSTVSVINTAANTVAATIPVGNNPTGVAISPDGNRVYVANGNASSVSVINTSTNTVTATVPVGISPTGISVSPNGSRVYVANRYSNTVSVINTATNTVVFTSPLPGSPVGVAVSPDGSRVYVADYDSSDVSVISTVTNTVTATIPVGNHPYGVSVSPDGGRLYVSNLGSSNVSVISTASNAVTATIPVPGAPIGISVSPDGSRVYVANYGSNNVSVISTATNAVTATVGVGSGPFGLGTFVGAASPQCAGTAKTFTITVNPAPSASISYSGSPYCASGTATPTLTGTAGGTYSSTAGLSINSTTGVIDLAASTAGTYTITYTIPAGNGCSAVTATTAVTIQSAATITQPADQSVCGGSSTSAVTFSGANGSGFTWTNNTPSIGLAATGSGNIPSFTATNNSAANVTATITVNMNPSPGFCAAAPKTFTITVSPQRSASFSYAGSPYCSGPGTATPTFTGTSGGTYSAASGLSINATTGAVDIAASTPGTYTVTYTIPAAFVCPQVTSTASISINPPVTATITASGPTTICPGGSVTLSAPATPGATYLWSNGATTSSISVSAAGTFTVAVTSNGCVANGGPVTISVNPAPTVNAIASQNLCNGAPASAVTFSGAVPGTVYGWTNNTTSIGLAASGSGDIASFPAVNNGTAPVTALIIVTPTYTNGGSSCPGTPASFSITVNPTPTVNNVASQVLCTGATSANVAFSGAVANTSYSWVNNNTSIGLAAAGTGDIAPFAAVNNSNVPVTATITVTPQATLSGRAYVPNNSSGTVSMIDLATGAIVGSPITVGANPFGVAVLPDRSKVYVSNTGGNSVSVINTSTNTVTGTSPYNAPHGLVASPDGTRVYVNGWTDNAVSWINAASNVSTFMTNVTQPEGMAVSADGARLYVASSTSPGKLVVINTASNSVVSNISVGNFPQGVALSADGSKVYVVNNGSASVSVISTASNSVVATIPVGANPLGVAVSPDGSKLYVTNSGNNNVSVINTATNALTASIAVGSFPYGVAVSPDGSTVYVANRNSNSVSVINAATNAVSSVTVGTAPIALGQFTTASLQCAGTPKTFSITVNPTATVNAVANQALCNGAATTAVNFSGAVSGTTFAWTNSNPAIGLAASGSGNIPSFTATNNTSAPVSATITVTPTYTNGGQSCAGTAVTFTITVNPSPSVNAIANQVLCAGSPTAAISFSGPVSGSTYSWTNSNSSIGLAATGSGNIASFTAANSSSTVQTAAVTVTPSANGCAGLPATFTISVNPNPSVSAVANRTACAGTAVAAIDFSGPVTGTVFAWTNSNPSIGIPAGGTGSIGAFTATNSTSTVQTATITVTPSYTNGGQTCTGNPVTFTITVQPTPTITAIPNQTVCNGAATTAVAFTGPVSGLSFTWTNNTPSIGLPASGSGVIPSFIATNSTASPVTATITVNPVANSCPGIAQTYSITVNPTPVATAVSSQSLCAGASSNSVAFSSTVAGSTFAWTNNTPSIGLATSGSGNIGVFTAVNAGTAPVVATVTVTPSANGCSGSPLTFTYTVNPLPTGTITAPNGTQICQGTAVPLQVTGGSSYQWLLGGTSIAGATGASYNATQPGTYSVNITNAQGCTRAASNSIVITLVQKPTAGFSFNSYCLNAPVTFSNSTGTAGAGTVSYQWSFGNGGTSTQPSPTAIYNAVGTYTVQLIASPSGCPSLSDTVTKTIAIEAPLPGQRLAPIDIVANRPTEIHARNLPNAHYSWTPATGLSNPALWYPVATLSQEQEYRILMSFNSGCTTVDTLLVRVQKGDDIFVPTAFSPDGDGVNDVLRPITVGLSTFRSFHIYDRMGRELFATSQINQGWDGTLRGTPLPAETYIWVVEGRDSNGQIIRKTGQVVLVR